MTFPDFSSLPIEELLSLRDRTAVVTGGARGIGAAVVRRLAEAGARVYSADLSPGGRPSADGSVVPVVLDVTDSAATADLVARIAETETALDIWVNAAGVFPRRPLLETPLDEWDRVLSVNLRATFEASRLAAMSMIGTGGGVIVNISSTSATHVNDNAAHYRTSKAGLIALTQSLAVELGGAGVRAVSVCPTLTLTEGVATTLGGAAEALERFGRRLPAGRAAVSDDVARAVLFAVSPLGGYLTGSRIDVDGGELSR